MDTFYVSVNDYDGDSFCHKQVDVPPYNLCMEPTALPVFR